MPSGNDFFKAWREPQAGHVLFCLFIGKQVLKVEIKKPPVENHGGQVNC